MLHPASSYPGWLTHISQRFTPGSSTPGMFRKLAHAQHLYAGFRDRVIVLEKSKVALDGPTAEILQTLVEKYRSSEPWDEDPLGELPQDWSLDR